MQTNLPDYDQYPPNLLLTSEQAALALAISPRKLWELKAGGHVPFVNIGRLVRYPVKGLREWIAAQQQGGEG